MEAVPSENEPGSWTTPASAWLRATCMFSSVLSEARTTNRSCQFALYPLESSLSVSGFPASTAMLASRADWMACSVRRRLSTMPEPGPTFCPTRPSTTITRIPRKKTSETKPKIKGNNAFRAFPLTTSLLALIRPNTSCHSFLYGAKPRSMNTTHGHLAASGIATSYPDRVAVSAR